MLIKEAHKKALRNKQKKDIEEKKEIEIFFALLENENVLVCLEPEGKND